MGRIPVGKKGPTVGAEKLAWIETQLRACKAHSKIEAEGAALFHVHRKTIRDWIRRVYLEWQAAGNATREFDRDKMRASFEEFYELAMRADATEKGPDYKAAATALDRLCKLLGVYEPDKIQVETPPGSFRDPDSIRDRVDQLLGNPAVAAKLAALLAKKP